jgi:hypothetical protein
VPNFTALGGTSNPTKADFGSQLTRTYALRRAAAAVLA